MGDPSPPATTMLSPGWRDARSAANWSPSPWPLTLVPNILVRQRGGSPGFEDITFHEGDRRFLIIFEARGHPEDGFRAAVEEYGEDLRYLGRAPVGFPLESENKGIEGVVVVAAVSSLSPSAG